MPAADELLALDADRWAVVVTHARRALNDLDEGAVTAELARLRALPTSRLASGRARERLAEALASEQLWPDVRERVVRHADPALRAWMEGSGPHPSPNRQAVSPPTGPPPPSQGSDDVQRLKERARAFQQQRDELQRRVEGAEARAASAEEKLAASEDERAELADQLDQLRSELARAADERTRAVDRERRRNDAQVAALEDDLTGHRRRVEELEQALQRERRRSASATTEAPEQPDPAPPPRSDVVPGRPSELPSQVRRGSREHAEALLPRGRTVIVDGYNVTLSHRDHLDIAEQRAWLLRVLSGAAASRGIEPTVVFDGEPGSSSPSRARGVQVAFSRETDADDEIEFRVAALPTDQPVTVVTDDRELQARVRRYGADVIGTRPFLWAVE